MTKTLNLNEFAHECVEIIRYNTEIARQGGTCLDYIVPYGRSAPGLGKTAITSKIVSLLGSHGSDVFSPKDLDKKWNLIDLDLRTQNIMEFAGMPKMGQETSGLLRPDWIPTDTMNIVLLDELPQASPAMLNVASTVIQAQRVGPHPLPRGTMLITLGNPPETVTGVSPLPEHTLGRLCQYDLHADLNIWLHKGIENNVHPEIISYLKRFPDELHKFKKGGKPFPSPRSWTAGGRLMTLNYPHDAAQDRQNEILYIRLASSVGTETAENFMKHRQLIQSLPTLSRILKDPHTSALPATLDEANAICGMLGTNLQKTDSNFESIMAYTMRMKSSEWSTILMAIAVNNHRSLEYHPLVMKSKIELANLEAGNITGIAA